MSRPLRREDLDEGLAAVEIGIAVARVLKTTPKALVRHVGAGYVLSHDDDAVDLQALPEEVALQVLALLGCGDDVLRAHLSRREVYVAGTAGAGHDA